MARSIACDNRWDKCWCNFAKQIKCGNGSSDDGDNGNPVLCSLYSGLCYRGTLVPIGGEIVSEPVTVRVVDERTLVGLRIPTGAYPSVVSVVRLVGNAPKVE